ncbi:MAG: nucleotide exchange factor GrpE [Candidatus Lloydbacteria bacterium CG22_combo_CG10-13_8_21_14_all_47_15]|uniref:Protein GrpE n=1 Tax=Candidatus Lloydbacteria bacterium CG22_combo_CG10-13_8_21_14_all_47_15 TaxID=1974635 RepID=A0A2H0CVC3_9BACT|nr:MAG: nucleotide exchange factor GrpE [Candidatus Lloydbacteria bacterium CG22_combo_CG10-13_8_21_14_all_47_15]
MKKKKDTSEEEIIFEDMDDMEEAHGKDEKIKKLREELKACKVERQEYLDGWQRARADFANARKEEEKRRGEFVQFAKEGILHQILPVVDSFDMAMRGEAWKKVDETWRKGVEYIHQQMVSILEDNGLVAIEAFGKIFDPNEHSSIESVSVETSGKDNVVLEVVQKGYRMNGKVIRPAKVKIGKYVTD